MWKFRILLVTNSGTRTTFLMSCYCGFYHYVLLTYLFSSLPMWDAYIVQCYDEPISVNLQYDDDVETTSEIFISTQPVYQGCVTSLQKHVTTFNFSGSSILTHKACIGTFFCVSTIVQLRSDSMLINGYVMLCYNYSAQLYCSVIY